VIEANWRRCDLSLTDLPETAIIHLGSVPTRLSDGLTSGYHSVPLSARTLCDRPRYNIALSLAAYQRSPITMFRHQVYAMTQGTALCPCAIIAGVKW